MESILRSVIWRFLRWLPSFVLRKIFSSRWLEKNIYIDIRPRHRSVELLHPDNPRVNVYLDVRNNTHFNIEIDRLITKFIYGIEMATLSHFKRERLKPGEERSIYITGNINYNQYKSLPFQHEHNSSHVRLEILAECNSRLHNFCIEKTLEGIKPEIANEHLLKTASKTSNGDVAKEGKK